MPRNPHHPTPDDSPASTDPVDRGRPSRRATETLRRQGDTLLDGDRPQDDFIALLAHELRSPLAPIRNALESLRRRRAAQGAPLEHELLVIDRQLDHLVRLVDDLLEVALVHRGQVELRRERLELADLVAVAVETVEPALRQRRQRMELSLPEPPAALDGDPVRLAQVFSNLLDNACKYSEPGSAIGLAAVKDDRTITVRIRDDGIGIPSERLEHLFDHIDQEEASSDRLRHGLGLGLPLVKALTELHGGSVEASSEGLGLGSVFTLRLPLATPTSPVTDTGAPGNPTVVEPGRRGPPEHAPPGARCRVLVVDDSIETRESFAELLRLAGHQVTAVQDGAASLEAARVLRPEVVFLDIGLPRMSGWEVAARLAELPGPRPLLVGLTGYGQETGRQDTRAALFDRFLLKPVDLREVQRILEEPDSWRAADSP